MHNGPNITPTQKPSSGSCAAWAGRDWWSGSGSFSHYLTDVVHSGDYYPFGMEMPGRGLPGTGYRYGFQGQEKDVEIKGSGNSLNYKYRMHDPRIGRFFAVDPLAAKYPYNSTYAFSENRVIDGVELEGLEFRPSTTARYGYNNNFRGSHNNPVKTMRSTRYVQTNPPTRTTDNRQVRLIFTNNSPHNLNPQYTSRGNPSNEGIPVMIPQVPIGHVASEAIDNFIITGGAYFEMVFVDYNPAAEAFGREDYQYQILKLNDPLEQKKLDDAQNLWESQLESKVNNRLKKNKINAPKALAENATDAEKKQYVIDCLSYNFQKSRITLEVMKEMGPSPESQVIDALKKNQAKTTTTNIPLEVIREVR